MSTTPLNMPKMSMTMTEGEVIAWHVEEGATFRRGDVLCEVLTDKVDMEVEAPEDGTLVRVIVRDGVVPVGEPIALLEVATEDLLGGLFDDPAPAVDAPAPPGDRSGGAPGSTVSTGSTGSTGAGGSALVPGSRTPGGGQSQQGQSQQGRRGPIPAVPRARALAREHRVDLASVNGSGPEGRVLVADVEQAVAALAPQPVVPAAAPTGAPVAPVATSAGLAPAAPAATPTSATPPATPVAPSQARARAVRAAVARVMATSAAVPQFTVWRDLDLAVADAARASAGKLSWTTVLLRAYAVALRRTPALLTQWGPDGAQATAGLAVGLAVDTPYGLLVPVFPEPDRSSAQALDADIRATVAAARGGKIDAPHLVPATATLSNLGGLGVDRFQALLTPPQASILALGAVSERPVAVPGGLGLALRVTAGLTVDHRVADGADGARLLATMAEVLSEPDTLL